jgi:hypothetical protein
VKDEIATLSGAALRYWEKGEANDIQVKLT